MNGSDGPDTVEVEGRRLDPHAVAQPRNNANRKASHRASRIVRELAISILLGFHVDGRAGGIVADCCECIAR